MDRYADILDSAFRRIDAVKSPLARIDAANARAAKCINAWSDVSASLEQNGVRMAESPGARRFEERVRRQADEFARALQRIEKFDTQKDAYARALEYTERRLSDRISRFDTGTGKSGSFLIEAMAHVRFSKYTRAEGLEWLAPLARRVQRFNDDGRPIIFLTLRDVRGRTWISTVLRHLGWKVHEGRVFMDISLFEESIDCRDASMAREVREVSGSQPPGRAAEDMESALADRQQRARVCECRDRKGAPFLCRRSSLRTSLIGSTRSSSSPTRSQRSSARSRSRWAASTCSSAGASRSVARGTSSATAGPLTRTPFRRSPRPGPKATLPATL